MIGVAPLFIAVKEAISPIPPDIKPILVMLFVQLYELPVPVKLTKVVEDPLHTVCELGWSTVGVGFTVKVNILGKPGQVTPVFVY